MAWQNNFSLFRLSATKLITLYSEKGERVEVYMPSAKQMLIEGNFIEFFNYFKQENFEMFQKSLMFWEVKTTYDLVKTLLTEAANLKEFTHFKQIILKTLKILIPDFWIALDRSLMIREVEITEELWDSIMILWKEANLDKTKLQKANKSDFTKKVDEQQKIIDKLKQNSGKGTSEDFMKVFLWILYAFPTYTEEILWAKTMYEISWLQKQAAASIAYDVEKLAYTSGNFKKGQKLTFFLNKK